MWGPTSGHHGAWLVIPPGGGSVVKKGSWEDPQEHREGGVQRVDALLCKKGAKPPPWLWAAGARPSLSQARSSGPEAGGAHPRWAGAHWQSGSHFPPWGPGLTF